MPRTIKINSNKYYCKGIVMALPKRQHSKTRGRKRRTHWKLEAPNLGKCSHCQKPVAPHKVCPYCGYYKGKQIIEIKPKKKKEKRR